VKLKGYVLDRRGLVQVKFRITPVELVVVPRATYAEWIARKYLAGTRESILPLISTINLINVLSVLRQGSEYYGNRAYQPRDNLKNELIVREYNELSRQNAVILVNLTAGDIEEADKLAYNILATALSLAHAQIPAALAVYNHEEVVLSTASLPPPNLVARALQIIKDIKIIQDPARFLNPPDIRRLAADILRLQSTKSESGQVLRRLLQMEMRSLQMLMPWQ
jgi:hypothetical protein